MRLIGTLLFIIGIIVALISATKLPIADSNWSDMLLYYVEAVAMALIGLLLLHRPKAFQEDTAFHNHTDSFPVIKLLQELITEMQKFEQKNQQLECDKITIHVKLLLDVYVLPFAAKRQELIAVLGQTHGIEVLVATAQGERLLNRTWSAASDENISEVIITYSKALAAFEIAHCKSQEHEDVELHT